MPTQTQIQVVRRILGNNGTLIRAFMVRIDGDDYTRYFGPGITTVHDADAAFSSATLPVLVPFTLNSERHVIEYYAGWNIPQPFLSGRGDLLAFKGEIVSHGQTYWPRNDTLTAGGALKRTEEGLDLPKSFFYAGDTVPASSDRAADIAAFALALAGETLDDATALVMDYIPFDYVAIPIWDDADIITHIINSYGITSDNWNHSIESSGWRPARLLPINWDQGSPGWQIIQEIDRVRAYRTFDGRNGAVYRRQVMGMVPSIVKHTFEEGVDILDFTPDRTFTVSNQVIVRGAQIEGLTGTEEDPEQDNVLGIAPVGDPPDSPYIPDPPRVRTDESINSPLIEFDEDAQEIAEQLLAIVKQPLLTLPLTTFGLSDFDVGDAVRVESDVLDIATNAFVIRHSISNDPFESSLDLRGSSVADEQPSGIPPVAAIAITVFRENIILAGVTTEVAMITVDGGGSSDSDGVIVTMGITIDGVEYPGPRASHLTTSPSPVVCMVSVIDNHGLTDSITGNAVWSDTTVKQEPLATAELNTAAATTDGEETWNTASGPYTAVAPIALGTSTLFGRSNGQIDRSLDFLATAPTAIAQVFPASITCLWNCEESPLRWWAGLENGQVWRSIDDGLTWGQAAYDFGVPVNDISEDPKGTGHITVAAGNNVWHSYSSGDTYDILIPHSTTCLRFAAAGYDGISRVYAGFADGVVKRKLDGEDETVLLTVDPVAEIRGLTTAIEREEVYIFTDSVKTYLWDEVNGTRTGPDLGSAANRAIRSPSGRWVYVSTDAALQKWMPDGLVAYDLRIMVEPDRVLAAGYATAGLVPVVPPEPPPAGAVEWVALDQSPGKIWHFDPVEGTLTNKIGNLPASIVWRRIAIDPLAPDRWIVLSANYGTQSPIAKVRAKVSGTLTGYSCMWYTDDAGGTWSEVVIEPAQTNPRLGKIGFNPFVADHLYIQWQGNATNAVGHSYEGIIYGSTASGTGTLILGDGNKWQSTMGMWDADAQSGEIVVFVDAYDTTVEEPRFITTHNLLDQDAILLDEVAPDVGMPTYVQLSHDDDGWIAYYYNASTNVGGLIARPDFRDGYVSIALGGGKTVTVKSEPVWFDSTDLYYHPTPSGSVLQKIPNYSSSNLSATAVSVDVGEASPGGILLVGDKLTRTRMAYFTSKGVFTFDGTVWGKSTYAAGSGAKFRTEYNSADCIYREEE